MNLRTTEASVQAEIIQAVRDAVDGNGKPLFKNYRFSKLSRIRTVLESAGRANYLFVDRELMTIQKAIHPHTAEEEDLHEWLRRYGLTWKPAQAARHTVRLGSSNPVYFDTPIPQGLIVTTEGPDRAKIKFKVLQSNNLPTGIAADTVDYGDGIQRYTLPVQIEALETGPRGNVAVGTISRFESAPDGLDFVYNPNPDPDQTGLERESIALVRSRINTAENATVAMWTPAWYRMIAETHSNVARSIFKSSKDLQIPGTVKLWLLGRSGFLTTVELQEILDTFDLDEINPGGVARIQLENFATVQVNKTVYVQFADAISIPDQETLDNVWETYFTSLGENEDFSYADMKNLYLELPRSVRVIIDPPGDVAIAPGEVAIPGSGWVVIGAVYDG